MEQKDYYKINDDSIMCTDCAFCDNCEERFNQCVVNYQHEDKPVHLMCCEYLHWNTMSDDEKAFFLQEVLPHKFKKEIEIEEDYCNYKVATLLIEKGLKMPFEMYVNKDNIFMTDHYACLTMDDYADRFHNEFIRTCTHQMAIKFLRRKGINICPDVSDNGKWFYMIVRNFSEEEIVNGTIGERQACGYFDTYEECIEVALKHVLENLI